MVMSFVISIRERRQTNKSPRP